MDELEKVIDQETAETKGSKGALYGTALIGLLGGIAIGYEKPGELLV